MKFAPIVAAALLAASLTGCKSHYAMAPLPMNLAAAELTDDEARQEALERKYTDRDIADLLDADIQARLPSSIAIARLKSHCSGYQPYLDRLTAEELAAWEEKLADHPQIAGVQPVTEFIHGDKRPTLHSLRVAAAKTNCELLLVYLQSDGSVDNFNEAAILYWTLVGLWIVPGNTVEHRTVIHAALLDCRTGAILGTASGDASEKTICSAALVKPTETRLARRAREDATADFRDGAAGMVAAVVRTSLAKRD